MTDTYRFLAIDLGAESGRGELVTLHDGRVTLEELHRFANRPVKMLGTLHWDIPSLLAEVLSTIRCCRERGIKLDGIGMDTWGVDFGLIGSDGALLGNPVHYRDGRTENIHEYSDPIMPREEIFAATGYEPWPLASLFQLLAMRRDKSPLLDIAETFLNIPDLFNYLLTGIRRSDRSIANTSNLMGTDCQWAEEIIRRFDLPRGMFPEMIEPASVLGPLLPDVAASTGAGEVPVIVSAGHDTSAAAAAIPAEGENWAFISCGTWSIPGCMIERPIATPRCSQLGFTNEYTIGGWYLARNVSGLWPVQELRRKWDRPDDPWDYARIVAEASSASDAPLMDVADESLLLPEDMEDALVALVRKGGRDAPKSRGQLLRGTLESLALEYSRRIRAMSELTGKTFGKIHIVGGGIKNELLCQFTAEACGIAVHASADQCSALGNALGQALALGILKDPGEIRRVVRASFQAHTYEPREQSAWDAKREKYARITGE